jgi:iron complex transport system substrate-binding protein
MMSVNGHHLMSDLVELCGGVNIFASSPFLTPVISLEDLLKADPEVIISSVSQGSAETEAKTALARFPRLKAVRYNHFYSIDPDLMHRQTPRLIEAARAVCDKLEQARATLADQPIQHPARAGIEEPLQESSAGRFAATRVGRGFAGRLLCQAPSEGAP